MGLYVTKIRQSERAAHYGQIQWVMTDERVKVPKNEITASILEDIMHVSQSPFADLELDTIERAGGRL
jgi:hypothetical protein